MSKKVKVLVGCPTYKTKEYCLKEFSDAVKNLKHEGIDYDILLVDNTAGNQYMEEIKKHGLPVIKGPWRPEKRERIMMSRNILRDIVLEKGYDFLLCLEQDVIPEPDTLQKMVDHKKRIITSIVRKNMPYGKENRVLPVLMTNHPVDKDSLWYVSEESLKEPALKNVLACHLGCTLIYREVLDFFPFRLMGSTGDYMAFSKDTVDHGFLLLVDTTIKPKHLTEN